MSISLNDVFGQARREKRSAPRPKVYAVRQSHGPVRHGDLVIRALGPVDAHRQYFNYFGLHRETHRYRLTLVQLDDDGDLAKQAITCQTPRMAGDNSLEAQIDREFNAIEAILPKEAAK